ncbi:hypothetical protein ACWGKA_09425, partial [Streptomyces luteogriseus]
QLLWNELTGCVPDQIRRQSEIARASVDFFVAPLVRQRRNRAEFADVLHEEGSGGASGARMVRAPGLRAATTGTPPRASSQTRHAPQMIGSSSDRHPGAGTED